MKHPNKHESTSFTRRDRVVALGAIAFTGLALGGTSKGREIVSDAYHPNPTPVHVQKYEHVGSHDATVFEQIGDEQASDEKETGIGKALMAYTVQPGDTEFLIAGKVMPDKDPREVAHEIIDPQLPLADRQDHIVRPGQVLQFER